MGGPGHLIFRREAALLAQRFHLRRLRLEGTPIVVAENAGFSAIGYQGFFSAGNSGALAYLQPDPGWNLVWFGRPGRLLGTVLESGQYHRLCNTPDGSRIFFDRVDEVSGNVEVWLLDLVKAFGPRRAPIEPEVAAGAEQARFTQMYFDFPGHDEQTWKAAYVSEQPRGMSTQLAGTERGRRQFHPDYHSGQGRGPGRSGEAAL